MPSPDNSFISEGKVFLVNCPKCHTENYMPAVIDGICVWCNYDANKDEEYKRTLRKHK